MNVFEPTPCGRWRLKPGGTERHQPQHIAALTRKPQRRRRRRRRRLCPYCHFLPLGFTSGGKDGIRLEKKLRGRGLRCEQHTSLLVRVALFQSFSVRASRGDTLPTSLRRVDTERAVLFRDCIYSAVNCEPVPRLNGGVSTSSSPELQCGAGRNEWRGRGSGCSTPGSGCFIPGLGCSPFQAPPTPFLTSGLPTHRRR